MRVCVWIIQAMAAEASILNWWEIPVITASGNNPSKQKVRLATSDMLKIRVDAIVNAANKELRDGAGICGLIFEAAEAVGKKDQLEKECQHIGFCPTGSSVVTRSYGLPADYIIHAVGPKCDVKDKPTQAETKELRDCCEFIWPGVFCRCVTNVLTIGIPRRPVDSEQVQGHGDSFGRAPCDLDRNLRISLNWRNGHCHGDGLRILA
jgi:hypothetical protein